MAEFRAVRIANPRRKKNRRRVATKVSRRGAATRRSKKNPAGVGGVLTIMANPKKRKRNARRRKNPILVMRTRNSRRRRNSGRRRNPRSVSRRRNPQIVGFSGMAVAKLAIGAGAGAIGTRALTQVVLKDKNQGAMGYVANAAVAIGLAIATGKFLGNDAGAGVLAGGLAATMQRVWDDKRLIPALSAAVSASTGAAPAQAAQGVKGLGDISYSDDGLGSLGIYLTANFPITTEGAGYGSTAALPAAGAPAPVKATGTDSQPW